MEVIKADSILQKSEDFVGSQWKVEGRLLAAGKEQRLVGAQFTDFHSGIKIVHPDFMNHLAGKLSAMGGGDYFFKEECVLLGTVQMREGSTQVELTDLRYGIFPECNQEIDFEQPAPRNSFKADPATVAEMVALTEELAGEDIEEL